MTVKTHRQPVLYEEACQASALLLTGSSGVILQMEILKLDGKVCVGRAVIPMFVYTLSLLDANISEM